MQVYDNPSLTIRALDYETASGPDPNLTSSPKPQNTAAYDPSIVLSKCPGSTTICVLCNPII